MNEENFTEGVDFTFAVVIRAKYPVIEELKRIISQMEGIKPIYQKWSLDSLYIHTTKPILDGDVEDEED